MNLFVSTWRPDASPSGLEAGLLLVRNAGWQLCSTLNNHAIALPRHGRQRSFLTSSLSLWAKERRHLGRGRGASFVRAVNSPCSLLDGYRPCICVAALTRVLRQQPGIAASSGVRRKHHKLQLFAIERSVDDFAHFLHPSAILVAVGAGVGTNDLRTLLHKCKSYVSAARCNGFCPRPVHRNPPWSFPPSGS
jgi:hypothetical protein